MYTHSILYYRHRLSVNKNTPKLHRSIISHPHHIVSYRTSPYPTTTTTMFRLLNLPWQARRHATRGLNLHQLVQSPCRHGTIKIQSDDNLATVREIPLHANRFIERGRADRRFCSMCMYTGKYTNLGNYWKLFILSFKNFHGSTMYDSLSVVDNFQCQRRWKIQAGIERKWYFRRCAAYRRWPPIKSRLIRLIN